MTDETLKELSGLIDAFKDVNYEISKFDVFNYDTLDEADPKRERLRTDITVEIGGPSASISFVVLTRVEHTKIKDAVTSLLLERKAGLTKRIDAICKNIAVEVGDESI